MREWTAVKRWREKRGEGRFPVEMEGRRERCRDVETAGGGGVTERAKIGEVETGEEGKGNEERGRERRRAKRESRGIHEGVQAYAVSDWRAGRAIHGHYGSRHVPLGCFDVTFLI
jgi:hypothetical protein